MRLPLLLGVIAFAVFSNPPTRAENTGLSVYFIGNSLTMSTTLDRVHGLFAQRGMNLQFGSQLSAGKSLLRHLNYAKEPGQKWTCWETSEPSGDTFLPSRNFHVVDPKTWRYGRYDSALAAHHWDALVMQPFLSSIKDDMEAIPAFMDLALKNNTVEKFYIYQTWPRRPRAQNPKPGEGSDDSKSPDNGAAEDIDFSALWTAEYTAKIDATDWRANQNCASRDYTRKLLSLLGEKYPNLKTPIRLIPVGEVLYAIDGKIKAGTLPGLKELAGRDPSMLPGLGKEIDFSRGVNVLYADPIHFNPMPHQKGVVGNFISGTTLFTVLSGQNPVGLSAKSYGFDDEKDAALIKTIQQTIWDVVTSEPATGCTK